MYLCEIDNAFTMASLPLNFYTSLFRCGCGFRLEQKYWQMDGFGEKKAQTGGFAYPYSLPSLIARALEIRKETGVNHAFLQVNLISLKS